jgi:very-short-patch-repair endonuclease
MYARMRLTPAKERSRLAAAAHDAVRGKKRTIADLAKRAAGLEQTLGRASPTEYALARMLRKRGCTDITLQKAVGKYNLDIAINKLCIAVEVQGSYRKPSGTTSAISLRFGKRTPYLFSEGWHVVIVTVDNMRNRLTTGAADYIVALCDEFRRKPPTERQYRVIRGNGQLKTFLSLEYQNGARIPRSTRGLKPSRIQDVPR